MLMRFINIVSCFDVEEGVVLMKIDTGVESYWKRKKKKKKTENKKRFDIRLHKRTSLRIL